MPVRKIQTHVQEKRKGQEGRVSILHRLILLALGNLCAQELLQVDFFQRSNSVQNYPDKEGKFKESS